MNTYFDTIKSCQESIIMKNFFLIDSMDNSPHKININYFLDNFDYIESLNLSEKTKSHIYHAVNNDEAVKKILNKKYVFSRLPFYLAYEKSPELLLNVVNFFNDSLNMYFKDKKPVKSSQSWEKFQNVVSTQGIEKIQALINADVFLPFQQRLMATSIEKMHLEKILKKEVSQKKKLKI